MKQSKNNIEEVEENFVTCLECGQSNLKQINCLHLRSCPGSCCNTYDYEEKYPGAPVMSKEYSQRRSMISASLEINCSPAMKEERLARSLKGAVDLHKHRAKRDPEGYRRQIERFVKAGGARSQRGK